MKSPKKKTKAKKTAARSATARANTGKSSKHPSRAERKAARKQASPGIDNVKAKAKAKPNAKVKGKAKSKAKALANPQKKLQSSHNQPSHNQSSHNQSSREKSSQTTQPATSQIKRQAKHHASTVKPDAIDAASITQALRTANRPLSMTELAEQLSVSTKQLAELKLALDANVHSGEVICNRRSEYLLRERVGVVVGVISAHRDGFGYVHVDRETAPIFLSHRQMTQVMHGDRVAVRVTGHDFKGRPEGSIIEVLERGTHEVVGRLYDEAGVLVVVPDSPRVTHRILIPPDHAGSAKAGQVVLVKLLEQPSRHAQPVGQVTRVLGEHAAPGMETDIAIHAHSLPFEFPAEVTAAAEKFGESVSKAAKGNREDIRALNLVTIDGEDARDFDDAVYCEAVRGGWKLIVAIADVASYVVPNSELDIEAQLRGTSVYFPNRVLPMLPEALSNGLCSLKPNVDRLCVACEMHINEQGKITRTRFFEGVMCSSARLTYTQVAAYLANPDDLTAQVAAPFGNELRRLHDLYKVLHSARLERGAIDFDAPELKLKFDNGKISAFIEQPRNDAHRLIEECMIAANIEAASFLKKHRIPTLYRVHGQPEDERLEKLQTFLRGFGVLLPQDRKLTSQDFATIIKTIAQDPSMGAETRLIETVVIRSLPQAVYQPENIGHFGLALPNYLHFTSPIRRYPDLIVHRGIRHVLRGGTADDLPADLQALEVMGQQCSLKERRADDATRDAMSWLKCEFMSDKIGEEFDAMVSGVVDFGLFVQVKGMQIDGLVHVSGLGSDYFTRDESGYRIVGQRSGQVFRLGDHLRVRLINVIIDERKIDFELANVESRGSRTQGNRSGSNREGQPNKGPHKDGQRHQSGGFRRNRGGHKR